MILAPRHIDRAGEVASILKNNSISFRLRTDMQDEEALKNKVECLLLDTVGELSKAYALGEIAFVGGSLIKRGGHNLLEPVAAGVPVLHGPHMHNFRAITSFLHDAGCAIEVSGEDELETNILNLLSDKKRLDEMKRRARSAYEAGKGATDKIMAKVEEFMS
jgi:3-deoxy-D-manno-octulosonic-acid transferase